MSTIPTYADSTIDDDGSPVARNQVKFSTIRTDLTDPLHNFLTANVEKANFSATSAPTQSDDSGDSYGVGSLWIDVTNDRAYICVDATPNAAVWNPLPDDYEEGTGTVTLTDGTNNATMTLNELTYTKIGNRVFFECRARTSSLGSVSGVVRLDGLPFTVNAAEPAAALACASGIGLAITAGQTVAAHVLPNTTSIVLQLWDTISGVSDLLATEWTNDGGIRISGSYIV